jgi:hypothetical protein
MNAIKAARRIVFADPAAPESRLLSRLALALGAGTPFNVSELYELDLKTFDIAMDMIAEWRLDRFYAAKLKLFDLSLQAGEMAGPSPDLH